MKTQPVIYAQINIWDTRLIILLIFLFCCLVEWSEAATAQTVRGVSRVDRWALVIGNSNYPDDRDQLPNAANDAKDMADALKELRFHVQLERNLNKERMEEVLRDFGNRLTKDSVGLFYYAGHGTQDRDKNYLIPVDVRDLASDMSDVAVSVDSVTKTMQKAENELDIIILDACRNQPNRHGKTRGNRSLFSRGFSDEIVAPAVGTLIAFATGPGEYAHEGIGRNGVFTGAFLEQLKRPDLDIEQMLKNARQVVVKKTDRSQVPWVLTSLIGDFVPRDVLSTVEGAPATCLNLLDDVETRLPAGSRGRLGRVMHNGRVLEPVLAWKTGEGDYERYSYRSCLDNSPTPVRVSEENLEWYESALVARFESRRTGTLKTFRQAPGLGVLEEGEARLTFGGAGGILEARRQGERHVEVLGTESVGVIRERIPVLLVTSWQTLDQIEPEVWDESWGSGRRDSNIGREIIWWELVGSNEVRIHPGVESFIELAELLDSPTSRDTVSWSSASGEDLEALLDKAAFSLLVAEEPLHIDLAKKMFRLANKVGSADLDIAKLEPAKADTWSDGDFDRLEDTAHRGRYWLLSRMYELAAIMPDRIAGKIRRAHHNSIRNSHSSTRETRFGKDHLVVAVSPAVQVANAVYQDQAVHMTQTMDFLGCLLGNQGGEVSDRLDVLHKGLGRLGFPLGSLREEMDVSEVFGELFQGFSVPRGLAAGERLFLGSLRRQDPEVLGLVQSLEGHLSSVMLEPLGLCKVALIPDTALTSQGTGTTLQLVASLPTHEQDDDTETFISPSYAEALRAKADVRVILEAVIHLKGAKHTKRKMEKAHKQLDRAIQNLRQSSGTDEYLLQQATLAFRQAEVIFTKARETAFRKEHSKSKVRVH